jgi:pimeloyl-ACP methyl ester carboxylesterase
VDFATNPLDGARIAYRRTGRPDQSPVVLVHGTALSQVIWRGFGYLRELDPEHPVITLDLRGHGRSDKPQQESDYTMDLFVADVLAVLDTLGVPQAHYLGYSLGGRVGFSVADAHPERILGFVSAAGAPRNSTGAFDRVFFPGCIQALEDGGMSRFVELWQAESGGLIDAATRAAFMANDATALAAYMRAAEQDAGVPDERLAVFGPRTLLLVGSQDGERLAAAEHAQEVIPDGRLQVLAGAGHGDLLRRPEARDAVRSFLR